MLDYNTVDVLNGQLMNKVISERPNILNTECLTYPIKGQEIQIKVTHGQITFFNMEEYDKDILKVSKLFSEDAFTLFRYLPVDVLYIIGFYKDNKYYIVDIAGDSKRLGFRYYLPTMISKVFNIIHIKNHVPISDKPKLLSNIINSDKFTNCIIKPCDYNIMLDEEEKLTFRKG